MFDLVLVCEKAKKASKSLLSLTEEKKKEALIVVAKALRDNAERLINENAKDIKLAKEKGATLAFIDRLTLNQKVIEGMAVGIEQVAQLNSPLNKVTYSYLNKEQDISIEKITVPFGVVGIIYESRPNVTADAFALCFKTSNAVILKGGSDSLLSNVSIVNVIKNALNSVGVDENVITVIEDTSRETTSRFMKMNKYVDLLIPRGGASLIRSAVENSTIPIIETGTGNCHIFVDESADIIKTAEVVFNAKTQRYSVCNACESLVIHSNILEKSLPKIAEKLKEKQVVIRADSKAMEVINDYPYLELATEEDFYTEYGSAIISVKTVDSLDEAIEHINEHSTKHSESIMTENEKNAEKFMIEIDSSSVYHNASTRFSDGFVFGLGAEIGISTQKLHARGPMGLNALVTEKYLIKGNGSVRK
ncbi:MAG: glutamate-5-semialdehyde dehydrogenase [Clostridiales bacterium]|nr:glutamate-5-semialdehyde dehydrogenase [Clostridiales bacterium]